jgi:hypothetical protein
VSYNTLLSIGTINQTEPYVPVKLQPTKKFSERTENGAKKQETNRVSTTNRNGERTGMKQSNNQPEIQNRKRNVSKQQPTRNKEPETERIEATTKKEIRNRKRKRIEATTNRKYGTGNGTISKQQPTKKINERAENGPKENKNQPCNDNKP